MDDNLAIFLVIAFAMSAAVTLIVLTSLIRARSRTAIARAGAEAEGSARKIGLLTTENEQLRDLVTRLEERLQVLERIATDPAERTAREIELLR